MLIAESDWRLLTCAFDLRGLGYEVMVEECPDRALELAKQWRPNVIIASTGALANWDAAVPDGVEKILGETTFLATIRQEDPGEAWEPLLARGFELLPMPLVHASELRAATDAALARRSDGTIQDLYRPKDGPNSKNNILREGTA